MPKLSNNRRAELIDHLVGNCDCDDQVIFNEDDIDTLKKMSTEQLLSLSHEDEEDIMLVDNEDEVEDQPEEVHKVFNEQDLPEEIREDLHFARNMKQKQKDELIAKITANESGLFTKEELNAKSVDELNKISSYVTVNQQSAAEEEVQEQPQAAPVRFGGNMPVGNENSSKELDDVLVLPVMNFSSNN